MPSPSDTAADPIAALVIPEAQLTIHQDPGNPGRIMFSLDLWAESHPNDPVFHNCDLTALTLFNLAAQQSQAFGDTYLKVRSCVGEISEAVSQGKSSEDLAAIREKHGVVLRAE